MLTRRDWLRLTLASAATVLVSRRGLGQPTAPRKLTVYKSPTCGCCTNWVQHMKAAGFTVDAHDVNDETLAQVKDTAGVPQSLRSCHVAISGAYAFEGHVPADLVEKVLDEKPRIVGLAVPGMPAGSPGMEMGGRIDHYDVMAFTRDGKSWKYAGR
jgi:hypothetical protein